MIFYKDKFRDLRELRGLTLKEIANSCNVAESSVHGWESGNDVPRPRRIPLLAKILNCKESDIAQYGGASGAPDRLPVVLDIKKIKKLIYDCGYSEAAFAKKINIPQATLSAWTNGSRNPSPRAMMMLAKAFNVDLDEIILNPDDSSQPELEKVVSDLAQKITDRAKTRAEMHRKLLLEAMHNEIRKQFPNATEPERDKILLELATGTIGEAIIFAEVGRMNSSIAAIADETREV